MDTNIQTSLTNNRNWFDIVKDGNGGYSGEVNTTLAPVISVSFALDISNNNIPGLNIFYYDQTNFEVRYAFGRDPNMNFNNFNVTMYNTFIDLVCLSVINYTSIIYYLYYYDSTHLYLNCSSGFTSVFNLSNLDSTITNLSLKKFTDCNNCICLFTINNSIYEIGYNGYFVEGIYCNLLVSDYIPGDYSATLVNDILYIIYTRQNDIAICSYTFAHSLDEQNPTYPTSDATPVANLIYTFPNNNYTKPRIAYFSNSLYIFLLSNNTIFYTSVNLGLNKPKFNFINSKYKANEIKIFIFQNSLNLVCLSTSNKLFQLTLNNSQLVQTTKINVNNTTVLNSAYDIININNEQYIFYIDSKNKLHQLWNPVNEIDLKLNILIDDLSVYNDNIGETNNMLPAFDILISDYSTYAEDYINKNLFILEFNQVSSQIFINAYPNQLIKITDSSYNIYYVRILPPGVYLADTQIINPILYQPGYYLTSLTFPSSYFWYIFDKNGSPVWYRRSNSDPDNLGIPQICSLFLGNAPNKVVTNVFNTQLCRSVINVETLEEINFFPKPDTRYLGNVGWDVHEALEIKLPISRKGNMIFINYGGPSAFYIQEQNSSGNVVFEIYSEDYFFSTDPEFFHVNSIDVHPISGDILCSFRNCSSIACFNYKTKNLDWALDSNGQLFLTTITPILTKFLTINDEIHDGTQYNGTNAQHDARWQTLISPLIPGNLIISAYDNESFSGRLKARGVVFEIDVSGNSATFRGAVYCDVGGASGYMGSYKIVKEINNSVSHVVDWVQKHPNLGEYGSNSNKLPTQNCLFRLDIPGDIYRFSKANPLTLTISSMRKTAGMPYYT